MRSASPVQRQFVLASKLRPHDPSSNWSLLSRAPAGTDPNRLALSIESVLHAQRSWNEVFDLTPAGDVVVESTPIRVPCPVVRYANVVSVQAKVQRLADVAFDLSRAPLYYTEVAVVDEQVYVMLIGAHVISDGFGFYNLIRDFDGSYGSSDYVSAATASAADIVDDYAHPLESAVRHYGSVFEGLDHLHVQEWDRRDGKARIPGSITRHSFDSTLYSAAGEVSRALGIRRYSVLLSAFALTVHALTGERTVVVSTPMSNRRSGPDAASTRGVRVNALPVRFDVTTERSFADLARATDDQVAALTEYEQWAFSEFSRTLFPAESMDSTQPSAAFTVYPQPLAVTVDGVRGRSMPVDRRYVQYPLTMNVEIDGDEVTLIVEKSGHLPRCDVAALYTGIVGQVLESGGAIPLPDIVWTDTDLDAIADDIEPDRSSTVLEQFAQCVRRQPDTWAVVAPDAKVSYRRLDEMSDRAAAWIASRTADEFVGLGLDPSVRYVVFLLGVWKARRIAVPIDTAMARTRVCQIVERCGGLAVISTDTSLEKVVGARVLVPPSRFDDPRPSIEFPDPDGTAYLLFTSGTTGIPKGVQISHRSVGEFAEAARGALGIGAGKRWLLFHSISFDISFAELFGSLLGGGTLYIPAPEVKRDAVALAEFVVSNEIEILSQTPSAFTTISARLHRAPALTHVLFCGERLEFETVAAFVRSRPDVRMINCYGITETTIYHTAFVLPPDPADFPARSVIGVPFRGVAMAVVDEHLRVLPQGVPGQLVVGGWGVMQGYLGDDEATRSRVVVVGDRRWYLTGDHGYRDDRGALVILGRMDRQVKIRGHRLELGEIEYAVYRTGKVASAHAMVFGSGLTAELTCFVVLLDRSTSAAELRGDVRALLPRYFEPDRFVLVEDLPVNTSGKVDAKALGQLRDVEMGSAVIESEIIDTEVGLHVGTVVREVWVEVLGSDDFDGSTRFFDAGGNSASLLQVRERLHARIADIDLEMVDLFEHCTPDLLTSYLSNRVPADSVSR
ncbi:amino acid adenylation domain-containing protein [Rhodococcus sp. 27YEA15]|uniref:AMP-binding protein n=1 Tax=Rhodococcus sp. 27YEA15 TaxID=3156259 RepID=UPI003C7AC5E2